MLLVPPYQWAPVTDSWRPFKDPNSKLHSTSCCSTHGTTGGATIFLGVFGFRVIFPIIFFFEFKVMILKCPVPFLLVTNSLPTSSSHWFGVFKKITHLFPHMGDLAFDECLRWESGRIGSTCFPRSLCLGGNLYEKKWPEIGSSTIEPSSMYFCLLIGSSISRILRKRWSDEAQQSPKNLSLHLRIPRWVEYVNLPCRTSIPMLRVVGRPGVYRDGFGNTWSFGTVSQRFWTFWGLTVFWVKKSNVQIVINM